MKVIVKPVTRHGFGDSQGPEDTLRPPLQHITDHQQFDLAYAYFVRTRMIIKAEVYSYGSTGSKQGVLSTMG